MQALHVISFEKRLQDDFPIGCKFKRLAPVDAGMRNTHRGKILGDLRVKTAPVFLGVAPQNCPHQATVFPARQFREIARVLFQVLERFLTRCGNQLSVERKCPSMVRTGHFVLLVHFAVINQLCTLVLTCIEKNMDVTCLRPSHEQWQTVSVMRNDTSRLEQSRNSDRHRHGGEYTVLFLLKEFLTGKYGSWPMRIQFRDTRLIM